ncbi:fimbrial protein [Stenotrophomonas sp. GD03993]|uniref:fimbrial protein n=1 Tax=unclassified Stenotrophomonas TaxID=196198 RepID=UPI00244C475A|nr:MULTISPECIES: fimbrial protein [Stenotrophomonas]MDH0190662.1 fimbrial protein [Stenotrophomonas sp. GD04051]MDH0464236.1 fimbrial protein [Stenotrophomonas sp. GD03993]MDH0874124.1 fimbrial protein [Stenotrophomonas sp. GD03877]MDH2153736.1 fimbrial protein [Stenotrophomonas sp. GD03657]
MAAAMALQSQQANASCVRLNPGDQDLTASFTMPNVDRPDTRYRVVNVGRISGGFECTAGQTAFNIDAPLAGLTYVRDVQLDSYLYKVYSTGPRSPLIGFSFSVRRAGTTFGGPPIELGVRNRHPGEPLTKTEAMDVDVYMVIFFRGGAMESIPMTDLGTITSSVESDPSQSMQHHVRLEITVPPVTCSLANASHTLDDVLANELAASGSNAKESSFDVTMNCPMDNIDVQLSLADANDPGSSNGQLAPAPGTTAGGVQVQLLRGGQPVQFGQAWSHGWSSKGQQAIPFSARYLRTADPLVPGDVKGEAVLTADYR